MLKNLHKTKVLQGNMQNDPKPIMKLNILVENVEKHIMKLAKTRRGSISTENDIKV